MREFDRIATFFAPLSQGMAEAAGLLDDAAFISPESGESWVITSDAISEGIHYLSDTPPELVARKLLRVNLSDLAAKGATPAYYTLTIMLPGHIDDAWVADFAAGLALDQKEFGIVLIGGDSIRVKGEYASFSLTALGKVAKGPLPLKRSAAQEGDMVCISGALGKAALGLKLAQGLIVEGLTPQAQEACVSHYQLPEPRLALGNHLLGLAHACMDISDGLVQDAGHIARASNKRLMLEMKHIPTVRGISPVEAITHGDDYELLFTLPEALFPEIKQQFTTVTAIGKVTAGSGVDVYDSEGSLLRLSPRAPRGWQH